MAPAQPLSQTAPPSVLIVTGLERPEDGSRLYRCAYQAKQLRNAGLRAEIVYYSEATDEMLTVANVVILARCVWNEATIAIVRKARASGKLVCGELDDKIFEPWDVDSSGHLRSRARDRSDQEAARRRMAAVWRDTLHLLPLFDMVLVSTPGLKDALEDLGIPALVARNALDTTVATPVTRERSELRRILVMSGTRTHDADLRLIARPLGRFLHENPSISSTFLGPITLPCAVQGLRNVTQHERVPVAELYPLIAEYDLCLVPLEKTVFNDCKSAIKFVECGLVSVPVIASPRREYREVIRDGETGFLAADDEESWYRTLCMLRDRPDVLRSVAKRAHELVLQKHTVASRGTQLADTLISLLRAHEKSIPSVRVSAR